MRLGKTTKPKIYLRQHFVYMSKTATLCAIFFL